MQGRNAAAPKRPEAGPGKDILFRTLTSWSLAVLLAVSAALVIFTGPFLTSDGPAHAVMGNAIRHAGDPDWPLQNAIYALNPNFVPNLGGEWLLAGLMYFLPPLASEQAIQSLCVLSLPLAGILVLRRISRDAAWLAVFLVPVAFQRLFFLGLYNFCLSMAGSLLSIWAYLYLREKISFLRAVPLMAIMPAVLVFQASGWIESVIAIGMLMLVEAFCRLGRGEKIALVLRDAGPAATAMAPGFAMFAWFLLSGGNSRIAYGPDIAQRIGAILHADALGTIGRGTTIAGMAVFFILLALAIHQAFGLLRAQTPPLAPRRRDLALGLSGAAIASVAFVFIMPDHAGGGWTHVWRAEAFPYAAIVLAAAAVTQAPWIRWAAWTAGATGAATVLFSVYTLQTVHTPPVTAEFEKAGAFIGRHCTVVPILFGYKLDPDNSARLVHHPLFHIVNRYDLEGDRVVLFNYLARLRTYPVQFRPGRNPQELLYHWAPEESDTRIYRLDIENFERQTGTPVDYVLIFGPPDSDRQEFWTGLHNGMLGGFTLVHRSDSGRLELYRRASPGGCSSAPD